jgi:hypothetical protein
MPVIGIGYSEKPPEKFDDGIFFRMHFSITFECQLDAGVDKKSSENIDDPVKLMNKRNTGQNKNKPHNLCADNPPEENTMLIFSRNLKVGKDEEKYEEIVNTQRFLDKISREKIDSFFLSSERMKVDPGVEDKRKSSPYSSPYQRFFYARDMIIPVKKLIQQNHADNENIEEYPDIGHLRHEYSLNQPMRY